MKTVRVLMVACTLGLLVVVKESDCQEPTGISCPTPDGMFGLCPLDQGTCCLGEHTCCGQGYKCGGEGRTCTPFFSYGMIRLSPPIPATPLTEQLRKHTG